MPDFSRPFRALVRALFAPLAPQFGVWGAAGSRLFPAFFPPVFHPGCRPQFKKQAARWAWPRLGFGLGARRHNETRPEAEAGIVCHPARHANNS